MYLRICSLLLMAIGCAAAEEHAQPGAQPSDKTFRVHMLCGSGEYGSATSLPKWAEILRAQGHTCTIAKGLTSEVDLNNLKNCEVLIVFCKRWNLNEEQLKVLKAVCTTRPILGIRVASHAFQSWLGFDNEVMGGTYSGHGGAGDVQVKIEETNKAHPVLAGIAEDYTTKGKVYSNPPEASGKKGAPKVSWKSDNVVLMQLSGPGVKSTPGTWVRQNEHGQRVFYTSLGYVEEFDDPRFQRLLANAFAWVTEGIQPGQFAK